MAQVFSAALFLLLPIASLLQFTVATHPTDGVADRLGIGTFYGVHKHFADTSVTLGLGDGKSVKLDCDGDNGVTAQIVRGAAVIGGTERVKDPALVIEEKNLVFIRTASQTIRIPFKKHSSSLLPSGKERVIWKIAKTEAGMITAMLIGDEATATPFGIAFMNHLVLNGAFSNGENNWGGKGDVKLVRCGEELFTCDTERRDLGWRRVRPLSGVIAVKGLEGVEQQTVRIDALGTFENEAAYDITFGCSGAPVECVFAAVVGNIPCLRKRTGEGLFQGPWETIEKYAKKQNTHEEGNQDQYIVYGPTLASHSIATPVFASLWAKREHDKRATARGNLVLLETSIYYANSSYDSSYTQYTFHFELNEGQEAIRVHYQSDKEAGWKFTRWENWSRLLVKQVLERNVALSGFSNIKGFGEGFFSEESRIDENKFMIGKYFEGWFSFAGLQLAIDGVRFVGFCGLEEGAQKFIVDDASWGKAVDDSPLIRQLMAKYVSSLDRELDVLTLSGKMLQKNVAITVKFMFTQGQYMSCGVVNPQGIVRGL
eukprot:GHVS01065511.1.p1 GENE.GHVS01065511.1~~GHVS01065511.1.p1  ORF type:complete len:542 (+),score=51.00 GHVS01065511.1:147-1772(+)